MSASKFLQRVTLGQAREIVISHAPHLQTEDVDAEHSLGRISALPVRALLSSPHYRASAMDGIAVRARDTSDASSDSPLKLEEIAAEDSPAASAKCFATVDTGTPLPDWSDAVVRIENTRALPGGVSISSPVQPDCDVRAIGEDIQSGSVLFARGHCIRAFDIGTMLATGVARVSVVKRPRIALLATGGEVVEPGSDLQPGAVIEYNSRVIAAMASEWGARADYLGRVVDDDQALASAIAAASTSHDVVCVIAGSSAGRKDLTVEALAKLGELLFHGVDMMPGKPSAFAVIDDAAVLGVPGYPVSAALACEQLLRPLLAAMLGSVEPRRETIEAELRRKLPSRLGVEEFLRVCITNDGDARVVALLPRGAGSISTLSRADGLLRIAANSEGIDAGSSVTIELLRPSAEIAGTVIVGGAPHTITATLEDLLRRSASPSLLPRLAHLGMATHDAILAMANGEVQIVLVDDRHPDNSVDELIASRAPAALAFAVNLAEQGRYRLLVAPGFAATPLGSALTSACTDGSVAAALSAADHKSASIERV